MRTVLFNNVECVVKYGAYVGGRTRIQLIEKETGMPYANATLNYLSKNSRINNMYVFVKNYSENKGMYEALVKANVIKRHNGTFELGLNEVFVCELNACRICDSNLHLNKLCRSCAEKIIKENELKTN